MTLNEQNAADGLRPIRAAGYALLVEEISRYVELNGASVLDVGSRHGWFADVVGSGGATHLGIEPDRTVADDSRARGVNVVVGYFPEAVADDAVYDLVVFNDVLEHVTDLPAVLRAAHTHTSPSGVLAISIPTTQGVGYRTAIALARVGIRSPLDRLWQRGFPSPHLWYFDEDSLRSTVERHGFTRLATGRLPSIRRSGLRNRVGIDPRRSLLSPIALATVWLAAPVLNHHRASDAMWAIFRRRF